MSIGFGSSKPAGTLLVPGQVDMPKSGSIGFGVKRPSATMLVTPATYPPRGDSK